MKKALCLLLTLTADSLSCCELIPQNAGDAYKMTMYDEAFFCGVPVNVQSGMLFYIESMLPDDWQQNRDLNQNGTPDFFETVTALYALSEEIVKNGGKTEYGYLDDLVDTYFPPVICLPMAAMCLTMIIPIAASVSADLTADAWQDAIAQMDTLTVKTIMMGGVNGYGMSAYTKYTNASLAFIEFAASYEQVLARNAMLGVSPARADAAATIGAQDATVQLIFDNLDQGYIDVMPAINETARIWTPSESFLIDLCTDAFRAGRGEATLYETIEQVQQILDAIFTLA